MLCQYLSAIIDLIPADDLCCNYIFVCTVVVRLKWIQWQVGISLERRGFCNKVTGKERNAKCKGVANW